MPDGPRAAADPFTGASEISFGSPLLSPGRGERPAVASSADQRFVAWVDWRSARAELYGARVGQEGTPLDAYGIFLATSTWQIGAPAVASSGGDFLAAVARCNDPAHCEIIATRVSAEGEAIDADGIAIASGAELAQIAVAGGAGGYLLTWATPSSGIHAARIAQDGSLIEPDIVLDALPSYETLRVASDGAAHLITWIEALPDGTVEMRGTRIDEAGDLLDVTPFAVSQAYSTLAGPIATLAFDGKNYVAAWSKAVDFSYEIHAARVSPLGEILDPTGITVPVSFEAYRYADSMAAVFDGGATLLAWTTNHEACAEGCTTEVWTARIDTEGALVGAPAATLAHGRSVAAASGLDGRDAFVAWQRTEPTVLWERDALHIAGARFDEMGGLRDDPAGVPISTRASEQQIYGAAFDGERHFVVWTDALGQDNGGPGLFGARVTPHGKLLDPEGIRIADGHVTGVAVTFDGANFVTAWGRISPEPWSDPHPVEIARVSPDGALLDATPVALPLAYTDAYNHQVIGLASHGAGTLVVLDQPVSWVTNALRAVHVDQEGVATAPYTFYEHDGPELVDPAISFDGEGYLLAWTDNRALIGLRLTAEGAPLEAVPFTIATLPQHWQFDFPQAPAMAFDGAQHLVVWHGEGGLFGTRVSAGGEVLDPAGFFVAPTESPFACARLHGRWVCPTAAFDGERFLLAWCSGTADEDPAATDLAGAAVSPEGGVLSTFEIAAEPGLEATPILMAGGGDALVAYTRYLPDAPHSALRAWARRLP